MIYDDIKNLADYKVVSEKVLKFIKELKAGVENGRYEIDENSYANINTYETKPIEKCGLEAHKRYIDIQLLLSGTEQLDHIPLDNLKIKENYNEEKDIIFYDIPESPLNSLQLFPSKFALLYPHEAHMPQMIYDNKSELVKKVVVKIRVI